MQAFCRVAAVAGATYVLRHPVAEVLTDRSTSACVSIRTTAGQTLRCGALAADCATLADVQHPRAGGGEDVETPGRPDAGFHSPGVARAVCITDASLQVN